MILSIIHWLVYAYYCYLFAYASVMKIIQNPDMMRGMEALGFGKHPTLAIGYAELIGVLGLLTGIFFHEAKNASTIYLFPFSVGALLVHLAHRDYADFYDALFCTAASLFLLATDKFFRIVI